MHAGMQWVPLTSYAQKEKWSMLKLTGGLIRSCRDKELHDATAR